MPSATTPVRIPAWQRLGLKLKFTQTSEQTSDPSVVDSSKRKSIDSIELPPSKKAKKEAVTRATATSIDEPITPNLVRKKSVTFTPETKVDDGDSIKQLFTTWVAEQKTQDPSFQLNSHQAFDTPEPHIVEEHISTTLEEKERKVKRTKKSEKSPKQSTNTTKPKKVKATKFDKVTKSAKEPIRPFLRYLEQYHEDRKSWKFNKNHQNHLLKHIFNVEVIPSDHIHLIYEYVRGLQGGVRTRLRDAALSVKIKDIEDGVAGFPQTMADRDKKQREYDAALKEYVATMTAAEAPKEIGYEEGVILGLSDAAMADRVAKRLRAEQILAELEASGEIRDEEDASNGPKMTYDEAEILRSNNGSQKVVRKRKQRTMVDDDTSSSGDSSDSESSSDDDSGPPQRRFARVETSSSSSSSSSSDSSDEDDSSGDEENDSDDNGSD